jgi:hypothetical protein
MSAQAEAEVACAPADETPVSAELALAIREERATAVQPQTTLPSPREWEASMAIAREIAATTFVPESYRGKPEAVVAAILTGRELGIGPMQALRDIHMVDGRPAFAAQLMLAKMRQGGIVLLETDSTEERAWIKARRPDTGEVGEFEFTIAEAETAGLLSKPGKSWHKYRKDMLWARAVSRMARRFGSDLLGGLVYSKEELDDLADEGSYGGGGSGYDAGAFDPGKQLLPDAPRGDDWATALQSSQHVIASDLDWPAILAEASLATIGPRDKWGDSERSEFRYRWANTITYLLKLCDEEAGDAWHPELGLAPEADGLIVKAFEWGFGMTPSLPFPHVDPEVIDADAEEVPDDA